MLYPIRSLSWMYHAFHSLLSVIESHTVSIRTRHNTATNWEVLSKSPLLVGGLSVGQQATYHVVCSYLQLAKQNAPQLFSPRALKTEKNDYRNRDSKIV
jgi:hypothetical protein